jgi:hypothetical protein
MAAQDPILLNLTGATFLLTAESGGIIQSYSRKTSRSLITVYDGSVGYDTGEVYHNPVADYDVRVITTASTGFCAAAPGVALTLANVTTGNGVATGGIYTQSTSLDHTGGALREFSVTAHQKPGIT